MIPALIAGAGAIIGGLSNIYAGKQQAEAANRAAGLQYESEEKNRQLQREIYERELERNKPYEQAGVDALSRLTDLTSNYRPFSSQDLLDDPGYQFRLEQGRKELENLSGKLGGVRSSNFLKSMLRFNQGLASQETENAFNRFMAERNAQLNPLQSLAGVGQTTSQFLGNLGTNYASNISESQTRGNNALAQGITGGASARSSGYLGAANTLNNSLTSYLDYAQNESILKNILSRKPSGQGGREMAGFYGA